MHHALDRFLSRRMPPLAAVMVLAMTLLPVMGAWAAPRASHFKLANGLEVVVIPDHRAPVVTHMVFYRVGAADEPPGSSGIAHFLEHLMFKGTDTVPAGQFSKIVARNGGQDNAFTTQDTTAYFQRVAKDRLALVMKMEADRMANLKLAEDDVLTERKVILEERRSRVDNDPSSILQEQIMAALYQNHPYGIPVIGWEHEIAELTREDALAFYRRFYAPNNAILVVAGDVTAEEVRSLAEETYGKLEPHGDIGPRVRPREPRHYAPVRVILKDARAGRATVQRYYLAPSASTAAPGEAEALEILMRVLGANATGRLYKELVVTRHVAANAGGWYGGAALDSSTIGVYAVASDGTRIEDVEKAIDEVIEEVRRNGITEAELNRARNKLLAEYVYASDSQAKLARRYGWGLATGQSIERIESLPERLAAVGVADVQQVAQRYFDIDNSVTGVLLPVEPAEKATDGAEQKKS